MFFLNKQFKVSHIVIFSIALWLLVLIAFTQIYLKNSVAIWMLATGLLTILLYKIERGFMFTLLFYLVLFIMLFANFFVVINIVNDKLNTAKLAVSETRPTMQMNWMYGVFGSFILTPIALIAYHLTIKRNKKMELIFIAIFTIQTFIIHLFC